MKNILTLSLIFCNTLIYSQNYKTAVGIKGGYPGFGSLNAKHFISDGKALEATFGGISRKNYGNGAFLILDYEIQQILESSFSWYYGGGGLLGFTTNEVGTTRLQLGINSTMGIEYTFEEVPINCSLNMGPLIFISPEVRFSWGGGLSIRYAIR
tara:strand:- start:5688 stop:6149 length:462 start_codon:yes stop_codon:yes gene_type:complete